MVKLISLKCPECSSVLSDIKDGQKIYYCPYCGAKIYIGDDNKEIIRTYRKVDEARIKEAEVNKEVRLKELELEKVQLERDDKLNELKKKVLIALGIVFIISVIFHLNLEFILAFIALVVWKSGNTNNKKEDSK